MILRSPPQFGQCCRSLQRRKGSIALDQMRAIDRARLVRKIARIDPEPALGVLREMFAAR